jgi:3D (Asp-Asp-Asp) domain-containing protein
MSLLLLGCDDQESGVSSGTSEPAQSDLAQASRIAGEAQVGAIVPKSGSDAPPPGSDDLGVLGGNANQNQQALRQRFGLADPTQDQLAQWEEYDARLTAYSNKDADWPYPTAASSNWTGATSANGDPLALEGTTVAVDFNRIPRGSLIYIPALDMFAEANDTGATGTWANADAGRTDYGANGAGRVDVYNLAGDRSSGQVDQNFQNRVGSDEYGQIYIVHRGPGWKNGDIYNYEPERSDELRLCKNIDAMSADRYRNRAEPVDDGRSLRFERKSEKPGRKIRMDRQNKQPDPLRTCQCA